MQVNFTSRHGSVSESSQRLMTQKAEKLLTYFDRVTAISVTVDTDAGHQRVEILVDAEHKHNFVATETDDDLLAAFDKALHKMEQQIRKYKERIQDHRGAPSLRDLTTGETDVEPPTT